ncbi:MAG: GTPase HflX [Clostridia bacterium]|nr:GTPase HflX [Clostridia bacterium]
MNDYIFPGQSPDPESFFSQPPETEPDEKLAVLCAISEPQSADTASSLDELERLCETASVKCVSRLVQPRERPDNAAFFGKGKLFELSELCRTLGAGLAVFDSELSPVQIRNIESVLPDGVRVIDRTMLILDIFAAGARTAEGMLQVEIAQLKYSIPRLIGSGKDLSRQGGGIGTRGPGESKLELDRRRARERINSLEKQLDQLKRVRATQRRARERSGIPRIAVAGYTNAGKSTLINRLTGSDIYCADKLFATLDPTTRRLELPDSGEAVITDTVGFVNRLPHHLVEAFRSTLDEVCFADVLLVVFDSSDPELAGRFDVTYEVINSLFEKNEVYDVPRINVFNKCDKPESKKVLSNFFIEGDCAVVSAVTGEDIGELLALVEKKLSEKKKCVTFRFPPSKLSALDQLYRQSNVESVKYLFDGGVLVTAFCDAKILGMYGVYISDDIPDDPDPNS